MVRADDDSTFAAGQTQRLSRYAGGTMLYG